MGKSRACPLRFAIQRNSGLAYIMGMTESVDTTAEWKSAD